MMAANSKSTLANPSCGDAEQRACREAFDKAGYWPNEVMWKAWQQAWTASRAFVPPPPSSELPIPDNERWLHEPENKANLERAMAVATKPSSDALAVSELAAVKEALDAAGAYVGGSLASRVQSLDTERRRLIDEARAAVQNDMRRSAAFAALLRLCDLKRIKRDIEAGLDDPEQRAFYEENKEAAWDQAFSALSETLARPTAAMYEAGEHARKTGSDAQGIYIAMLDARCIGDSHGENNDR